MPLSAPPFDVTLARTFDETSAVRTFRFLPPPEREFAFIPGQFMMLNFADDPKVSRAYNVSSSPLEKGYFEVTLNQVHTFTERMFKLKPGEKMQARGPYGKWHYDDRVRHAVMISGGTGITPFRCMTRYVLAKKLPNKITIMHSTRTPADIIFRGDLAEFAKSPNVTVFQTVTRPEAMGPGETWSGPTGRIDLETIKKVVPDYKDCGFYMCGPNKLVAELDRALLEDGIPKERIRYEKWGEF